MKKSFALLAFIFLFALRGLAQNWASVSASNITDLNQQKLASGTLCFLGTDQNDNPIDFQAGGGGQVLKRPYCAPVTNGAVTTFTVPNPANTIPAGIYYRVTAVDSSTGLEALRYTQVAFTGGTFNFDNYSPTNQGSFSPLTGTTTNGNLSVNGRLSVTGSITSSCSTTYENIRNADCFSGADWCAKVMAADADLGTAAGEIWMNQSAGTSACASTLALSANHALHFVQGGTYNLNSGAANGIAVNNGDSIIGPNDKSLVLAYAGTATELAPQSTAALTSNVLLQNVSFTGTPAGSIGLDLNNSTYWSVEHVIVSGFSKTGAIGIRRYTSGGLNGSYYDYFNDVYSNGNYDDWVWDVDGLSAGVPPNRDRCIFCKADNSTRYGFNINAGGTQSFYGCSAEVSGNTALVVNTSDNHFDACNLENFGSSGTGINLTANSTRNFYAGTISSGFATQKIDNTTAGNNSFQLGAGFSSFYVSDSTGLPADVGSYLFMGGNYLSSILGRIYVGNNTGWQLCFSSRHLATDTDLYCFRDNGILMGSPSFALRRSGETANRFAWDSTYTYIDSASNAGFLCLNCLTGGNGIRIANNGTFLFDINSTGIIPDTLGKVLGTSSSPIQDIYVGAAATNNLHLSAASLTGARSDTFPDASGTVSLAAVFSCGTGIACSATPQPNPKEYYGTVALTSGSVTVTGMGFTSSTSFVCIATDQTTAASVKATNVSATSVTFMGTSTDVIGYDCKGT